MSGMIGDIGHTDASSRLENLATTAQTGAKYFGTNLATSDNPNARDKNAPYKLAALAVVAAVVGLYVWKKVK